VEAGRVHLELGHTEEAVRELEAALACEVDDINAFQTRMDAERLLAQVRRQPWKQPSLIPPHAEQQAASGGSGGSSSSSGLLHASISTSALLNGHRQPEIVESVLKQAQANLSRAGSESLPTAAGAA
jgi:hypothetical protein